jgi:hypothetical protein
MRNACNASFLNLQLYVADNSPNGITLNHATGIPTNTPAACDPKNPGGSAFVLHIGTEGWVPAQAGEHSDQRALQSGPAVVKLPHSGAGRAPHILIDFSAMRERASSSITMPQHPSRLACR